jgi:hypothetical protein
MPDWKHRVTVRNRQKDCLNGQPCSVARQRLETRFLKKDVPGFRESLELESADHPIQAFDFVVCPVEGELVTILVPLDVPPPAPGPRLE